MSLREATLPALLLAIIAALLIGGFAAGYSWTAIAFPLAAGGAVCVLCIIELMAIRERRSATVPVVRTMTAGDETAPLSLESIAWMFVLALFLFGLGFVAGPAAYLLICMRANGFSWSLSTGIAAASLAVTWGLFIKTMGILLPIVPLWMP